MRFGGIHKPNTTEPRLTINSKTTPRGRGLGERGGKKCIIEKRRRVRRMSFSEKNNIRRMRSNKVNTIGMLKAKFRRDRTVNVEKSERKRVFKGGRKRGDFERRKKGLSKRIAT